MAFMKPHYTNATFEGYYDEIEHWDYHIPQGFAAQSDGKPFETIVGKWWCRLSADGYMDATEWEGPFDSEQEARHYVMTTYDIDPDTGDELQED